MATTNEASHIEHRATPLWFMKGWLSGRVSDTLLLVYLYLQARSHPVFVGKLWTRQHRVKTSARDIASHLHINIKQARYALKRLEHLGLIKREHTPGDKREYTVVIPYLPDAIGEWVCSSGSEAATTTEASSGCEGGGSGCDSGSEGGSEAATTNAVPSGCEPVTDSGSLVSRDLDTMIPPKRKRSSSGQGPCEDTEETTTLFSNSEERKESITGWLFELRKAFGKRLRYLGRPVLDPTLREFLAEVAELGGTDEDIRTAVEDCQAKHPTDKVNPLEDLLHPLKDTLQTRQAEAQAKAIREEQRRKVEEEMEKRRAEEKRIRETRERENALVDAELATPLSEDELRDKEKVRDRVLKAIKRKGEMSFWASAIQADFTLDDGMLTLTFADGNNFHRHRVAEGLKEQRDAVNGLISQTLGRPVQLRVR